MAAPPNITTLRRWRTAGMILQLLAVAAGWLCYRFGLQREFYAINSTEFRSESITTGSDLTLYGLSIACGVALIGLIIFIVATTKMHRRT